MSGKSRAPFPRNSNELAGQQDIIYHMTALPLVGSHLSEAMAAMAWGFIDKQFKNASEVRLSIKTLLWRRNDRGGVSNHQPHDCLLNCLFRRRSNKTSKLRVTGLCVGNSPGTGEFPAQRASNAANVSIWWRHHVSKQICQLSSTENS